jgi:hypothetical protein
MPPAPPVDEAVTATPYAETADWVTLTETDIAPPCPPAPPAPPSPDELELEFVTATPYAGWGAVEPHAAAAAARPRITAAAVFGIVPSARRSVAPQWGHATSLERAWRSH